MYKISEETYEIAKKNNLIIKTSTKGNFKLDVYDINNKYLCSIGDSRYLDYHLYKQLKGEKIANDRRILYHKRHHKDINGTLNRGSLAALLLW